MVEGVCCPRLGLLHGLEAGARLERVVGLGGLEVTTLQERGSSRTALDCRRRCRRTGQLWGSALGSRRMGGCSFCRDSVIGLPCSCSCSFVLGSLSLFFWSSGLVLEEKKKSESGLAAAAGVGVGVSSAACPTHSSRDTRKPLENRGESVMGT